jgi:hypothetical protein
MTLWSIFRSPLIFGGDLPSNDPATTALITNEEVLQVDQNSHGGHQALDRGNIRAWVAEGAKPGERYVAVFNLGDAEENINVRWKELGIEAQTVHVRDLWQHQTLGSADRVHVRLRPHASVLYSVNNGSN